MIENRQTKRYFLMLIIGFTLLFYGIGWILEMAWAGASIGLGVGLLMVAHRINPKDSRS